METYDPDKWMNVKSYTDNKKVIDDTIIVNGKIEAKEIIWEANVERNKYWLNDDSLLFNLLGDWAGEKVIVVGAGPSVNEESIIEINRLHEKGARIIAVDRIHAFLKRNGITPDITLSCDRSPEIKHFLRCVDSEDTLAMNMIQDPRAVSNMMKKTQENVYLYILANPFSPMTARLYEALPKQLFCIRAGFLVGFAALDLAMWMNNGAKIYMIGNDLGWSEMMKVDLLYRNNKNTPILQIELKDGRSFFSIKQFIDSLAVFKKIKQLHPQMDVTDCSNGLLVDIFKQKNIKEVLA